jgi:transcriptional regulator with PAS, ATPase and Fis domain
LKTSLKQQKRITARFKDELEVLRLAELADQEIVAKSPAMARTLEAALKLARHGVKQILLTGESGTGKGLLAKFIPAHSPNASEPFIHINCAALPETLLEAELFGHEAGAFTGAAPEGRAGLFEAAGQGTAFLDEIGEIPLNLQAKLLTFLDNREFRRLAGRQTIPAPCTVIAATNSSLEQLAARKKFRQDLYWRLSVFCLHLPPLRERPEDLLELARREVAKQNAKYGLKRELDAQTLELFQNYPFPGNVRELLNRLQQAILLSEGQALGPFLQRVLIPGANLAKPTWPSPSQTPNPGTRLAEEVARAEKLNLAAALKTCASTREMAAHLGISQASVSRKLRKHGLKPPQPRSGRP